MNNYKKLWLKLFMLTMCTIAFMPACTDLEEEIFSEVTADNFFQTEEELIAALGEAYTAMYGFATGGYGATQ